MADDKVEFELVSPEALLLSKGVDMVVIPGTEGDFGVLPRHAPVISTVRPGVIQVFEGGEVSEKIFVAGGFAEVTPARCTVLAEEAMPVARIDRAKTQQELSDARDDVSDAQSDHDRAVAERKVAVAEAKLQFAES